MNIVFTGGFTYPIGMAPTKRVQHLMDYFIDQKIWPKVLVYHFDKSFKKQTFYKNVVIRNTSFLRLLSIFFVLKNWKQKNNKNFLYVYDGINIENIFIVLIAIFLSYKIISDIVEDYKFHTENISTIQKIRIHSILFFEKIIDSLIDGVVVISKHLYDKYSSITKKPVIIIPGSANVIKPEGNQSMEKDFLVLAYVGTFGKKDGLEYLLQAFNILSKKQHKIKLKLAGKGNNIEELISNYSNKDIEYVGFLSEEKYYQFLYEADMFILNRVDSIYANAGFPYKLPEYLATGKSVIATNISGIDEYLKNFEDALLIPPEDIKAIINAVEFLIQNPDKRKEIGMNGFKKYERYFSYKINGKKLHEFMLQL